MLEVAFHHRANHEVGVQALGQRLHGIHESGLAVGFPELGHDFVKCGAAIGRREVFHAVKHAVEGNMDSISKPAFQGFQIACAHMAAR